MAQADAAGRKTTALAERKPKKHSQGRLGAKQKDASNKDSVVVTIRNRETEVNHALFSRVIFPDNKWIKRWDVVMLVALFLIAFLLPYQIGVSGGHEILASVVWLVCNMSLNAIFFIDTFLYFFRAYYDRKTKRLVWHPAKIRRHYLRTMFIPNALSVLPFTLTFYILSKYDEDGTTHTVLVLIKLFEFLKLLRLFRIRSIVASSNVVQEFRARSNSQVVELYTYVVLIVIVSHWFACIWSFVAVLQTKGFDKLEDYPNWIRSWWEDNAVNGGLNPIGRANHIDRYFLSLFWSIQTLTSIGYGNIAPITLPEWIVACVLQLMAGVMWAYVIGGLVGVAAGIQVRAEEYRGQADDANELISQFQAVDVNDVSYSRVASHGDDDDMPQRLHHTATQIRRYVYKQYTSAKTHTSHTSLAESYPVYNALSPQLQQDSSWLIFHPYINSVPYLSSQYLSDKEQARVATHCRILYYGAGETADLGSYGYNPMGRGIAILAFGCAFTMKGGREHLPFMKRFSVWTSSRTAYGLGRVLSLDETELDDGTSMVKMHFASFTKVIFIPQEVVLEALERNKEAWRSCGRWWYLRFMLLNHEKVKKQREGEKSKVHLVGSY